MHTFVLKCYPQLPVIEPLVLWDCDGRRGGKKGCKHKRKTQRIARRAK